MNPNPAVRVELTANFGLSLNQRTPVMVLEKARNEGGRAFRSRVRARLGELAGMGLRVSEARLDCADRRSVDERALLAQTLVLELARLGAARLTLGGKLTLTREGRLDLAALAATVAEHSGVAVTIANG